jgi:cytidylate kinase
MTERFDFRSILRPRERREALEAEPTLYLPDFDVLTISGFAGTGKTSAADDLNRSLIGTRFIKVGQNVRAENKDITNVPPQKDIDIDREQERLIIKTLNSTPLILESRFGGVIGADVARLFKEGPKVIRVLTTADEKIRHERLVRRTQEDHPELTTEEIIEKEIERDRKFVSRMNHLYPYLLNGQHPFDPEVKTANGQHVYNVVLDTTHIPKGKVKDALVKVLEERNYIHKLRREDFGEGESGNRSYELIKQGALCEYNNCQKIAKQTLDSSSKNSVHSFPVCSESHAQEKTEEITTWAEENNFDIKFGKNGKFEEDSTRN